MKLLHSFWTWLTYRRWGCARPPHVCNWLCAVERWLADKAFGRDEVPEDAP